MSKIIPCDRPPAACDKETWKWDKYFHKVEKGKAKFVSPLALINSLVMDYSVCVQKGVVFETRNHDFDVLKKEQEPRWFAIVENTCGYYILSRFVNSTDYFWTHVLSRKVHTMLYAKSRDPKLERVFYCPPYSLKNEFEADLDSFIKKAQDEVIGKMGIKEEFEKDRHKLHRPAFRAGQRVELLSYANSLEIRVAHIQEVCGRRLNVTVRKRDYPRDFDELEDDRQAGHEGAQYWIDQDSFMMFPVGWAAINNYQLIANEDYIEHTKKIAEAFDDGTTPRYEINDATPDQFEKPPVDPVKWDKLNIGQKFELLDPLSQQFKCLHVASVMSFCKSDGYMIISMDGPQAAEESFPIHFHNLCMYPMNYARKHGIKLAPPDEFVGKFKWDEYLKKQKAVPVPEDVFKPMPSKERMDMIEVGMHLEAADMCENQLICPATIKSIHGRHINVNFDGWDSEFDQLYDIDSHDIFPAGWCDFQAYMLQHPKTD
ncbi:hypothetical protein B9Z55_026146 [Caenorhabditis nigoni]|uniref:SLED domain-containing protein n=1 Tax=Caenorhabditis nigoni TaxID=1611254 RepID=A0A2G5T207_9PELO|nr:hypothetical protein B9Z55_026146 [Caenorhabditis nigoni]